MVDAYFDDCCRKDALGGASVLYCCRNKRVRIVDSTGTLIPEHAAVLEDLVDKANIFESIILSEAPDGNLNFLRVPQGVLDKFFP